MRKSIKIISVPQLGEARVVGKHLYTTINKHKVTLDEYDMLVMADKQDCSEAFNAIIKYLDMAVPVENDTYFALRCNVLANRAALKEQHNHAMNMRNAKTYLMTDGETGATKIGKSINPPKRERTLQSEKKEISLLMICDSDIEKKLHQRYSHKRIRGEWFNLSRQDIAELIKQYNFKPYAR